MSLEEPIIKCVFFDRDGIVNQDPAPKRYVESPADFLLNQSITESLGLVKSLDFLSVLITNQKGVGSGVMSLADLESIHAYMNELLASKGLAFDDIYFCTATENSDPNRKPNPGMLLAAAEKHKINLSKSWMIGDSERDVVAGKSAGCKTVLINENPSETVADHVLSSVCELPEFLKKTLV